MIYLAANKGVIVCDNNLRIIQLGLEGQHISSLAAQDGSILAGTNDGIFYSEDEGRSWRETSTGLNLRYVRWITGHPLMPGLVFAGTEPAGIFISSDGGASWREAPEVIRLRDQNNWFLPYSPEAGCVRGFAFHGERVYAAVEVGGALRSDNNGADWRLVDGSSGNPSPSERLPSNIHPDVHSINAHPSSPDLVFAPTGGGFYVSTDGGKNWRSRYDCYCRAVWVDPQDPSHLILGPADGVDRNGRIEETHDGGESWEPASIGLRVPWRNHMVERFIQVESDLFAVLSNGKLICSTLPVLSWRPVLNDVQGINDLVSDHT